MTHSITLTSWAQAHETLRTALEIARQDDPEAYDKAQRIASQEIGR